MGLRGAGRAGPDPVAANDDVGLVAGAFVLLGDNQPVELEVESRRAAKSGEGDVDIAAPAAALGVADEGEDIVALAPVGAARLGLARIELETDAALKFVG